MRGPRRMTVAMAYVIRRIRERANAMASRFGVKRFVRDERGTNVVEFSIVALPFVGLMLAILQTAIIFFAQQTLETAVANSARLIRTGQAQQQNFDATTFKNQVCSQIMSLFDCQDGLYLDVRTYPTFAAMNLQKPVDQNGDLTKNFTYQPGHGGQIVVVRAFYEWPVVARMLGLNFSNLSDGKHLMAATAAFRNEPFPW